MSGEDERNNAKAVGGGAERAAQKERELAAALARYVDRSSREEEVDIDEFCKGIPELAKELRPLLESLQGMDGPDSSFPSEPAREATEELPDKLSGHKILGEIGAGGRDRVLLGLDEPLGRNAAINTPNRTYPPHTHLRTPSHPPA